MASRIIFATFLRKLSCVYVSRNATVLVSPNHPYNFKSQASFLHIKTYDTEVRHNEELPIDHSQVLTPSAKAPKLKEEILSTNPDIFGNAAIDDTPPDPGDVLEDEYIQNPTRRSKKLRTKEYANMIKEHLINNRVREAIDVLEIRMLKEDRVKPEVYIYSLLISGCAKAGYTKKAFQLFQKMKQRDLKVKGGTYTSLFNACANAPSIADGLSRANYLREVMLEKGYEPNVANYNAMIKAYGRCGDTKTSYMLADEMLDKGLEVNTDTFNFLLQACASDKRYGFRHALLTWHRMHKNRLSPDYYSFNLMLRCVRDTSIGDVETMENVLKYILEGTESTKVIDGSATNERLQIAAKSQEDSQETIKEQTVNVTGSPNAFETQIVEITRPEFETPNLLTDRPHIGSLLSIEEVTKPHDRLLLLGGFSGFLQEMKKYGITPGIETFTSLLEVIPPTYAAEKQLITMVRKIGLKSDIDFFNILIKKRSMRFDYEGAKEVISMIQTAGLYPDIVTYGVLALGCQTQESARELIAEMRSKNIRMNAHILGAMLRQGCAQKTFPYVTEILQISLDENIRPNEVFLRHLDTFYKQSAKLIDMRHYSTKSKTFKKEHGKFCSKYRTWQEELGIAGLKLDDAIRKVKQRPYQQFSEATVGGLEDLKNEKLARKTKMRKYIKKIKVANLRSDEDVQRLEGVERPAATKTIETV